MASWFAPSVDLEPNKDGTLEGVVEAMEWFDETVPRGTIYATYRIATERPDLVAQLADEHEIGVHLHPREFGHDHDQFAELEPQRQREVVLETRSALATAAGIDDLAVTSFRAGRHSISKPALSILANLDFEVDASININYKAYLPEALAHRRTPFVHDSGLFEIPTTFGRSSLLSKLGLRTFPGRTFTATANTLRTDRRGTTGLEALEWLLEESEGVSFYMHPYDATTYHADLSNSGESFRERFESLVSTFGGDYLTASELKTRFRG